MASVAIQISASPQYQRFLSAIENPNTRVLYEGVLKIYVEFTGAKTAIMGVWRAAVIVFDKY